MPTVRDALSTMLLAAALTGCLTSPSEPEAAVASDAVARTEAVPAIPAADVAPAAAAAADAGQWKAFGAPFAQTEKLPASAVIGDPEAHAGKPVRMVGGELAEVCQAMGCWAVVRDDQGHSMRITMKDHGFGIDKDTVGRACDVEGELVRKPVDPERVAHMASEGGGDAATAPEAGKTEAWELVASSVAIAVASN